MLKRISVESVLVMFLFIMFTACIGILIVEGQESYASIIDSKEANEDLRIALNYINMKVKQNDYEDNIQIVSTSINQLSALEIKHHGEEEGYYTYVFYEEDYLYECYIYEGETISIEFSEQIIPLQQSVNFTMDEKYGLINVESQGVIVMSMNTTSKVVNHEE